jgi:NAD(P)-dependent dehydrogenase (short-subunit alcohol dehydrogenase family)
VDARALAALSTNDRRYHSHCDVSTESSVRQLFDDMIAQRGGSGMVSNAGIAGPAALWHQLAGWAPHSPSTWQVGLCAKRRFRICARAAASIINLSSTAGRFGFHCGRRIGVKWGVIGFCEVTVDRARAMHSRQCNLSVVAARIDSVFTNKAAARGYR